MKINKKVIQSQTAQKHVVTRTSISLHNLDRCVARYLEVYMGGMHTVEEYGRF